MPFASPKLFPNFQPFIWGNPQPIAMLHSCDLWVLGEEPFLNAVMKVFNADRSADPSTYKDLAAQCVPAFLDMVMANLKDN